MSGAFFVAGADANTPSTAVDALFVVAATIASVPLSLSKLAGAFVVIVDEANTPSSDVNAPSIAVLAEVVGAFVVVVESGRFVCCRCCRGQYAVCRR